MKQSHMLPGLPRKEKVIATYLLSGAAWIALTDWAAFLVLDSASLETVQTMKGWLFIAFSGALLYLLLRSYTRAAVNAEREKIRAYHQTLRSWVDLLDVRHKESQDHTVRVTRMTENFARTLGVHGEQLECIRLGAMLHDVGKLMVPDHIINKPGRLDPEEWVIMKQHPTTARNLLEKIDYLDRSCIDIPYCHHERWDGAGYPRGIAGDDIPYAARLFAIVDVWDAMSMERSYKPAIPEAEVLAHIRENAGTHFDPDLAQFFCEHYREIRDYGIFAESRSRSKEPG